MPFRTTLPRRRASSGEVDDVMLRHIVFYLYSYLSHGQVSGLVFIRKDIVIKGVCDLYCPLVNLTISIYNDGCAVTHIGFRNHINPVTGHAILYFHYSEVLNRAESVRDVIQEFVQSNYFRE